MKTRFFLAAALLVLSIAAFADSHPTKRSTKAQPATEPAIAPVVPQTLEQMPAKQPKVTFQNGMLTIAAENCTLGDILRAVKSQTGAEVEFPGNASDRVVGQFGPGPARDVLGDLLNGSHFNYVLLGSATNADALDRVILTPKSASAGESSPAPEQTAEVTQPMNSAPPVPFPGGPMQGFRARNAGMAPQTQTVTAEPQDPTDDSADDSSDADAQDDQADDSSGDDQQSDDAQQGDQAAGADQQNPNGQNGVKSPEQLLQELQQQQQQQGQPGQPGVPQPGMQVPPGQQGPHN